MFLDIARQQLAQTDPVNSIGLNPHPAMAVGELMLHNALPVELALAPLFVAPPVDVAAGVARDFLTVNVKGDSIYKLAAPNQTVIYLARLGRNQATQDYIKNVDPRTVYRGAQRS